MAYINTGVVPDSSTSTGFNTAGIPAAQRVKTAAAAAAEANEHREYWGNYSMTTYYAQGEYEANHYGKVNWNPPAHNFTKPPKASWSPKFHGTTETLNDQLELSLTGSQIYEQGISPNQSARLGSIRSEGSATWGDGVGQNSLWGCHFHYNPTSLSLSARGLNEGSLSVEGFLQQSESIDLLGQFGYLDVDLYFNRIYDLAYPEAKHYVPALAGAGNHVGENHMQMIQRLGTQYDIEHLYRVANGDPKDNELLGYKSSDLGMLVWRPAVFDMGPFKFRGTLTHVSVNHIMFNPHMVPIFSVASVGFMRFPGSSTPFTDSKLVADPTLDGDEDAEERATGFGWDAAVQNEEDILEMARRAGV